MRQTITHTYNSSQKFTNSHYENFPVISLTIPKELRKHVGIVYQFARQADDLADEGEISPENRLESLKLYSNNLQKCLDGEFADDFWMALKNTIDEKNLTPRYFFDLLSAFTQDVVKNRYANFSQLLDYCSRSANPVGRIMLELFNVKNEDSFQYSDQICTALQLTNFYQDVSIDLKKNRIYIPVDEMQKFGVEEKRFDEKQNNANFKQLMKFQVERTYEMFAEGRKLFMYLPKSLLPQIRMTVFGGEKILHKIMTNDYEVLNKRPKLTKLDYMVLFFKGMFPNAG